MGETHLFYTPLTAMVLTQLGQAQGAQTQATAGNGAPVTFGVNGNAANDNYYNANGGGTKGGDTGVTPDLLGMNGNMLGNAQKQAANKAKLVKHQTELGYMVPGCPTGMKPGKARMCF